jgi:hypothetical protein
LVPDPVPGVGDAVGETAGADVAGGVAVTVTVGGGGAADVGGGAADVGGGSAEVGGGAAEVGGGSAEVGGGSAEVGGGSAEVVPAPGFVAVRLGRLLIMLLAVLPHPASRQATTTTAAARIRPLTGCRMLILS